MDNDLSHRLRIANKVWQSFMVEEAADRLDQLEAELKRSKGTIMELKERLAYFKWFSANRKRKLLG